MDPTATSTDPKEQRLLAAIVFTDVVGFSKLAAKNEARVYNSLQRDMGVMTDLCRAHGGQVLNTMGDGMLMCFTSAVDAMSAAVEIQRTLAAQAQSLPATDILQHRIDVHLGDVIMKGDNVFGDGVNTAARLQNDARPGSIWFSHTVHEVVKNKLKLDGKYVGKRAFKNLGEPVQVWEVPPVTEIRAQLEADSMGLGTDPKMLEADGVGGGKAVLLVLVSLLMIGSVVFLVTRMRPPKIQDAPKVVTTPPSVAPTSPPAATTGTQTSGGTTDVTTPPAVTQSDVEAKIADLKRSYAFGEIVQYLSENASALPESRALIDKYTKLAQLRAWMEAAILTSTAADMIVAQLSIGDAEIYNQQPPVIQINKAGFTTFELTQLSPKNFLTLARAIQQRPSSQAPPEMSEWLAIFSEEYPESA